MPKETHRITFRSIHKEDAGYEKVLTVFCPQQGGVVSLERCHKCPSCRGLSIDATDRNSFLRCTFEADAPGVQKDTPAPHDLRSPPTPARDTPLSRIMTSPVRCATPDTSLESLTAIFLEAGISAVPVVDSFQRPVGIISKTDVLRQYYERGDTAEQDHACVRTAGGVEVDLGPGFHTQALSEATVADVMTHLLYCLGADASISRAAALMSYEGVHRIVVTGPDGRAIGIVSSLDILRWMARWDGYVVPGPEGRGEGS